MNTSTGLPLPYWCLEEMEEEYVRDYYVHLERDVMGQSPDILRHTNQLHNVHRQFLMRGNQIPTTRGQNHLGALSNMVHKSFQDWQRENAVDIAMNLYDNKIAEYNDIDTPHIKKKRDYGRGDFVRNSTSDCKKSLWIRTSTGMRKMHGKRQNSAGTSN